MLIKILYLLLFLPVAGYSQFYYKDLVSTGQTMEQLKQYRAARIKKVTLRSFDGNNEPIPGFVCFQEVTPSFNAIKTYTQTTQTLQSVLTSQFNFKGQLIRSADSSNTTLNVSAYTYDAEGRVATVESVSQAYAYKTRETEKRIWTYKDGKPGIMWRIKNGTDTLEVKFILDEAGNVAEEEWWKKNRLEQKYYYYYDDLHRLTDLVRYNERAKRLLPDFIFEYSTSGLLIKTISIPEGSSNYVTWQYQYNEKSLKIKESCFSKQKELIGYVTYTYE
jgi:hypothetical protein